VGRLGEAETVYRASADASPSQPRSVQHRWALRQATQRPPWYLEWAQIQPNRSYFGTALINERAPVHTVRGLS